MGEGPSQAPSASRRNLPRGGIKTHWVSAGFLFRTRWVSLAALPGIHLRRGTSAGSTLAGRPWLTSRARHVERFVRSRVRPRLVRVLSTSLVRPRRVPAFAHFRPSLAGIRVRASPPPSSVCRPLRARVIGLSGNPNTTPGVHR